MMIIYDTRKHTLTTLKWGDPSTNLANISGLIVIVGDSGSGQHQCDARVAGDTLENPTRPRIEWYNLKPLL